MNPSRFKINKNDLKDISLSQKNWCDDEFTRGCYGGHFSPGVWTGYGKHLRKPIQHIHCAGSETATIWNGYMEGAVRSGERAAEQVSKVLGG